MGEVLGTGQRVLLTDASALIPLGPETMPVSGASTVVPDLNLSLGAPSDLSRP